MASGEGVAKVWGQGLYSESVDRKHEIGQIRMLNDGRVFQYAKSGEALVVGTLNQGVAPNAADDEIACAAAAIGSLTITTTGTVTVTENEFADGFLVVNKGTAIGHTYKISGHPAATGAVVTFQLVDPVRVALVATDEITFIRNLHNGVIIHPTAATAAAAGVSPINTTSGYYFWNQVRGVATALTEDTDLVVGEPVRASDVTAGSVAAIDWDEAGENNPQVGILMELGDDAEGSLVDLTLA